MSWRCIDATDAVGIILTSHEQGGALAFKVCFLGWICKDLGVVGASGAEELPAGVTVLSIDRSHSLFTDEEFEEIPVVCSSSQGLHKVRAGQRKSPPHTTRVKTGAKMISPFSGRVKERSCCTVINVILYNEP